MIESTFEHLLFNINEKIHIINELYTIIFQLFNQIQRDKIEECILKALQNIEKEYEIFTRYIDKYNNDIIFYISEYYQIKDGFLEDFNTRFVHTQSCNKDNYKSMKKRTRINSKFDISELIEIFNTHCYEYKKYNDYNNYLTYRYTQQQSKYIYNKLNEYILYENIYEILNTMINEYADFVKYHKLRIHEMDHKIIDKMNKLLMNYSKINLEFKTIEIQFDICKCKNKMIVRPNSSELVCTKCGYLYMMTGTVFDDSHFYTQNECRFKHAGYEPSKHCKCWIDRIQAKENTTISESVIKKLENCIRRDGIRNKRLITIEQFRGYLKDCNLSELNEHISLIRKIITGVNPPQLTYAETQDICNSFNKAIKAYNLIKPDTKSNVLYYPYILRKLIETHIDDRAKKSYLLSCIHLQGPSTLADNDNTWFKICKIVPSFKYKPTNRYEYL